MSLEFLIVLVLKNVGVICNMNKRANCGRCGNPIPPYQGYSNKIEDPFFPENNPKVTHHYVVLCFECQKKLVHGFLLNG